MTTKILKKKKMQVQTLKKLNKDYKGVKIKNQMITFSMTLNKKKKSKK